MHQLKLTTPTTTEDYLIITNAKMNHFIILLNNMKSKYNIARYQ